MTTLAHVPAAATAAALRPPRARLRGLGKRVVWLGGTLLALEIFYVVVVNLFLRFGLLPIMNRDPDEFLMAYDRAYSLWPGVAHIRGFRLRDQGRSIQWRLEIEEASVTIDLLALVGKTFSATRVRATGVAFRLRRRLDDAGAMTARAGALPPIEGLEDPPRKPIGPDKAPASDAEYDRWRVHLSDIAASAHEVWIEEHRLTGSIRVQGGLFLIPERMLHVGQTVLDIEQGELRIGDHVALTPLDAHVESNLGRMDLRGSPEQALRELSVHARVDARTPGLSFLRLYLGDPPELRLAGGSGSLHVDGRVVNGRVMPGTEAFAATDHLEIGAAKYDVTLDYHASIRVERASPEPTATGDLLIHRATVRRAGAEGAPPTLEEARAHFIGLPRDLAGPVEIARTELDLPAVVPDLRWLLPAREPGGARPVELTGSGAARARVDLDREMHAAGTVEASAHGLDVATPSFEVGAEIATTVRFHDADFARKHLVFDPSVVKAERVTVTRARQAHPGGELRVDLTAGRIDAGAPRDFALTVAAKTADLRWLDWKNADGGDPHLMARTASMNATLRVPYPASLGDGTAEEAAITGSLGVAGTGDLHFKGTTLRGDVAATALLRRLDLGRGIVEIREIHAVTRDLAVYGGAASTPGWWGRFNVSQLDVDTSASMTMNLRGDARCQDASPFNAILASEGVFPGWVGKLFPMEGLTASASVRRAHDKLDLGLRARGSSAEVTVRLHGIGAAMTGAVKVDTRLVSIGVGFIEGKSDVKVFAGQDWLNARIAEANGKEIAEPAHEGP